MLRYFTILILLASTTNTEAQITDTTRLIDNLSAFAKLYGYIRYFHPSDEAATVDWDKFAIYGCDKIKNIKKQTELLDSLRSIFAPIAPAVQIYNNRSGQPSEKTFVPARSEKHVIVSWQHYGMGTDDPKSIYKSVRVNRPQPPGNPEPTFAPVSQSLDGEIYAGKKLLVRAWMKVIARENNGKGHLWLRVDKPDGVGFFYNMSERPATDSIWTQYSFNAPIDKDANRIVFGAFLRGSGQLLIDDYEIFVEQGDSLIPVPLTNGSFEQRTKRAPKGWATPEPSYDYSVVSSDVKKGTSALSIELKTKDEKANKGPATAIFDDYPKMEQRIIKTLTRDIEVIIPTALWATKKSTYPAADPQQLLALTQDIHRFTKSKPSANELAVRLAGIVITWSAFRHFFPYWQYASKDPESLLRESLGKALQDESPFDFLTTLCRMTAQLNDGHIFISMEGDTTNRFTLPLIIDWVEEKVVITKVLDSSLHEAVKAGDIVETIDHVAAIQYLSEKEQLISGSPQWKKYNATNLLLGGSRNAEALLEIRRGESVKEIRLKRNTPMSVIGRQRRDRNNRIASLPEGIAYLDLDKISYKDIVKRMPALKTAKAIICDLRGYPNNNHQFIAHLLKKPENDKWMYIPRITEPDYKNVTYDSIGWHMRPAGAHLEAKIIFLTDGSAISYAESFIGFIKDLHLGVIVGQATAGANGNANRFRIPGGYTISFTGMMVTNHDGSQHHIIGSLPDVIVEKTVAGIAAGRDELLERAIELATGN